MTSVPPSLGELIRQQRELAALPMRQLAAMSGISGPYLSQIENGLRAPSDHVLRSIATTLGIDPEELVGTGGQAADSEAAQAQAATRTAIGTDPNLTTAQRRALLEVYAAMVLAATRAPEQSPGES
jgi:transcriptional regulator with XRE-family HTH domain